MVKHLRHPASFKSEASGQGPLSADTGDRGSLSSSGWARAVPCGCRAVVVEAATWLCTCCVWGGARPGAGLVLGGAL